jgi:hypothetical protein
LTRVAQPISLAITGPLADWIFEPAMMPGGSLSPMFNWLVGTGPGAGMALVFVFMGVIGAIPGLIGYTLESVRNIEEIIPDHDIISSLPVEDT